MQLEVTGNGVRYNWGLASSEGAWFVLFPNDNHTKEDIKRAKSWLRNHQDVVSCRVANEHDIHDLFRGEVFRDKRTRHLKWTQMEFTKEEWKQAVKDGLTPEAFVTKMLPEWEARPKLTNDEYYEQFIKPKQ